MRFIIALTTIAAITAKVSAGCAFEKIGYKCCESTTEVVTVDADGTWGIENGEWCGIAPALKKRQWWGGNWNPWGGQNNNNNNNNWNPWGGQNNNQGGNPFGGQGGNPFGGQGGNPFGGQGGNPFGGQGGNPFGGQGGNPFGGQGGNPFGGQGGNPFGGQGGNPFGGQGGNPFGGQGGNPFGGQNQGGNPWEQNNNNNSNNNDNSNQSNDQYNNNNNNQAPQNDNQSTTTTPPSDNQQSQQPEQNTNTNTNTGANTETNTNTGANTGAAPSTGGAVSCSGKTLKSNTTLNIGGRKVIVKFPSGFSGDKATPLLINYHPIMGSASQWESGSQTAKAALNDGAIVAFMDGAQGPMGQAWNVGPCCTDADDVQFTRDFIKEITSKACVDPKRIYAAGFSMGGGMSNYAGCFLSDVIAASAPSAFDLAKEIVDAGKCKPSRPYPILNFRGTQDNVVMYNGGLSQVVSGKPITFMGAKNNFKEWAKMNGCTGEPKANTPGNNCEMYENCSGGVKVGLCTINGGGHSEGDGKMGWDFLKQFTLP